ncbi:MAG: hypothetical protein WCA08_23340 [Desulfoferrobacter sp.]
MTKARVIEGTWEEIRRQTDKLARRFAGKRLKLILLTEEPEPSAIAHESMPEEKIRLLDALAEKNRGLPVLPPEAFERESLYEDRG